jgi:threonine/homoserine/homoserine lactone efflux protein
MYLGYQYFSAEAFAPAQQQTITTLSKGKILRQSVVVELTNPKMAVTKFKSALLARPFCRYCTGQFGYFYWL